MQEGQINPSVTTTLRAKQDIQQTPSSQYNFTQMRVPALPHFFGVPIRITRLPFGI